MTRIACIIPTLNEVKRIEPCLQSIFSQTVFSEDFDIIVVDGGSTDGTVEKVVGISASYSNVRLVENPGRIQSIGFNLGFKASDARYIFRMDAHAEYAPDYIERCLSYLDDDPTIGNVGGRCVMKPAADTLMARANSIVNHSRFGIGGSDFRVGMVAKEADTVPFGAFRRDVIETVGGMREDLPRGEDNEYNSRIRKAGYKVWFDPGIVSTYYTRPTLSSSARQMYNNGVSIAWLLKIDKNAVGIRHLIPLFFVLSIPLSCGLSLLAYTAVALFADYRLCKDEGFQYYLPLLALFPSIHFSYGWGTLSGIISRIRFGKSGK